MTRRDWYLPLRVQIIKRHETERNYGALIWNYRNRFTLDVYVGKTMWTLRRGDR
jgi:hypothetical protein